MSWTKYLSFIPAAIFFPTVLTLLFLNWKKRRLRRRLRQNRNVIGHRLPAQVTVPADAPNPVSRGYVAEFKSLIADLRREPTSRPPLGP